MAASQDPQHNRISANRNTLPADSAVVPFHPLPNRTGRKGNRRIHPDPALDPTIPHPAYEPLFTAYKLHGANTAAALSSVAMWWDAAADGPLPARRTLDAWVQRDAWLTRAHREILTLPRAFQIETYLQFRAELAPSLQAMRDIRDGKIAEKQISGVYKAAAFLIHVNLAMATPAESDVRAYLRQTGDGAIHSDAGLTPAELADQLDADYRRHTSAVAKTGEGA